MDGMEIGTSINAITGERAQSAIDPSTINKERFTSKDAGEHFHFKRIQDVRTDESSTALGFSSSITFPVDGLNVSSKQGVDFSSTSKSEGATVLYVLEWQRVGKSERLKSDDAKLKKAASDMLATSPKKFGRVYGDYFVYSITTKAKFLAVWYVAYKLIPYSSWVPRFLLTCCPQEMHRELQQRPPEVPDLSERSRQRSGRHRRRGRIRVFSLQGRFAVQHLR